MVAPALQVPPDGAWFTSGPTVMTAQLSELQTEAAKLTTIAMALNRLLRYRMRAPSTA
jgi:hypothetical protein